MDVQFAQKRAIWLKAFGTPPLPDVNSILHQIYTMMWDTTAFKLIASARMLSAKTRTEEVEISLVMHNLLDRCFFSNQMMTIRRLASETYGHERGSKKDKSTWALNKIVEDMAAHRMLFTRENILASYAMEQGSSAYLDEWNVVIDCLCGVAASERTSTDTVSQLWFDRVAAKLQAVSRDIEWRVDKFIAHAATPSSRARDAPPDVLVDQLWLAQEAICRSADFAVNTLLTGVPCLWIAPGEDWTRHMDKPLIPTEVLDYMNDSVRLAERQCEAWSDGSVQWFAQGS